MKFVILLLLFSLFTLYVSGMYNPVEDDKDTQKIKLELAQKKKSLNAHVHEKDFMAEFQKSISAAGPLLCGIKLVRIVFPSSIWRHPAFAGLLGEQTVSTAHYYTSFEVLDTVPLTFVLLVVPIFGFLTDKAAILRVFIMDSGIFLLVLSLLEVLIKITCAVPFLSRHTADMSVNIHRIVFAVQIAISLWLAFTLNKEHDKKVTNLCFVGLFVGTLIADMRSASESRKSDLGKQ